jgi:RNA polymerase sigma-70 factor (ECF subfamily)
MSSESDPDQATVERARQGDDAALGELLQRYREPVHAFAYRLLNGHPNAEDVAQETFVRAFQHLADFRFGRGARFSTWLFQLARHAALDELRRQQRRPQLNLDEQAREPIAPGPDAAHQLMHRELGEAIAQAVARLPEDQRTALVLTEYHAQSAAGVAGVLNCSVRSAEARLFRARQTVRADLARRGWT